MSNPIDGLQFPTYPKTQKVSTSRTGKEIIAEALANVDHQSSVTALTEKNWRKQYPRYFKSLVEFGIRNQIAPIQMAQDGLIKVHNIFEFYRDGQKHLLKDVMSLKTTPLHTIKLKGESDAAPEWSVPYKGQQLKGGALLAQIQTWLDAGVIEPSHAEALIACLEHPEWFDLSDRTMVLFGAASEAGPLTWLAQWKANIVAVDLPNSRVWSKILDTIQHGNATLYAPSVEALSAETPVSVLKEKLGANLLTQVPEIAQWLVQNPHQLDLAAIAYLDGEKHVRVSVAMDAICNMSVRKKQIPV